MSETLYSENPAMFRNHPFWFIFCVLLVFALGLGLLVLLGWYIQTRASKLSLDGKTLLHEQGLFSKVHSEIQLDSIRAITVRQSFLNRILGVGSVEVYAAGDQPEIVATGLPDPNKLRELVKAQQGEG